METVKRTRAKRASWPSEKGGPYLNVQSQKGGPYLPRGTVSSPPCLSPESPVDSPAECSPIDTISRPSTFSRWDTFPRANEVQIPRFAEDILFRRYHAYREIGRDRKRLEILLWACEVLREFGANKEEGAPLSAKFAEALFGKKNPVIRELVELGIIKVCKYAVPTVSCARYRYTTQGDKLQKVILKHPTVIEWKGSKERYARAMLIGARFPPAIFDNFRRFSPGPNFANAMDSLISKGKWKGSSNPGQLRDNILDGYWQFSVKDFRITNHIVNLPEEVRKTFVVNGEPVIERDFSNSHPCFLP